MFNILLSSKSNFLKNLMKKYKLFICLLLSSFYISATTVTVSTVGLNFTPQITNLVVGDTIHFVLGQNHNAIEVSQLTYNNSRC